MEGAIWEGMFEGRSAAQWRNDHRVYEQIVRTMGYGLAQIIVAY
jgi:hypothetical protein